MAVDKNIQRLTDIYSKAEDKIRIAITKLDPNKPYTRNRKVLLANIQKVQADLKKESEKWLETAVEDSYKTGSDEIAKQLKEAGKGKLDINFSSADKETVDALMSDTSTKFAETMQGITRTSTKFLDQMRKQKIVNDIASDVASGMGPSLIRRGIEAEIRDTGITAFTDRAGRAIQLGNYAQMLARTTVMTARNEGARLRLLQNGSRFAKVSHHADIDGWDICNQYEDTIVDLSDPDQLPPYHPNCRHVLQYIDETQLEGRAGSATTIREAEATAEQYADNVNYKGMSVKTSNQINRTLEDQYGKFQGGGSSDPLVAEARKYKTPEEFMSAQGQTVYHGTDLASADNINDKGFSLIEKLKNRKEWSDFGGIGGKGVSTSWLPDKAKEFAGVTGKQAIVEGVLDKSANIVDWGKFNDLAEKIGMDEAIAKLHADALIDTTEGAEEILVINLDKLHTKSQLLSIWEDAQQSTGIGLPRLTDIIVSKDTNGASMLIGGEGELRINPAYFSNDARLLEQESAKQTLMTAELKSSELKKLRGIRGEWSTKLKIVETAEAKALVQSQFDYFDQQITQLENQSTRWTYVRGKADTVPAIVRHELGHLVLMKNPSMKAEVEALYGTLDLKRLSEYSKYSADEMFAEAFSAYSVKDYGAIPPELLTILNRIK